MNRLPVLHATTECRMVLNDRLYNRAIAISLRQILLLLIALTALKSLRAVASVFKFVLRNKSPPRLIRRATDRKERCVVNILVSIMESTPEIFYRRPNGTITEYRPSCPDITAAFHHESSAGPLSLNGLFTSTNRQAKALNQRKIFARTQPQSSTAVPDNFDSESTHSSTAEDMGSFADIETVSHFSGAPQCAAASALRYTELVPGMSLFSPLSREFSILSEDQLDFALSNSNYSSREDLPALELDSLQKIISAASYPGKFPVSDNVEYSSLATAPLSLRSPGRLTRPFTDG